ASHRADDEGEDDHGRCSEREPYSTTTTPLLHGALHGPSGVELRLEIDIRGSKFRRAVASIHNLKFEGASLTVYNIADSLDFDACAHSRARGNLDGDCLSRDNPPNEGAGRAAVLSALRAWCLVHNVDDDGLR